MSCYRVRRCGLAFGLQGELREGQSLNWLENPLSPARRKVSIPTGARWWMKGCTQAKLALPLGGTPN